MGIRVRKKEKSEFRFGVSILDLIGNDYLNSKIFINTKVRVFPLIFPLQGQIWDTCARGIRGDFFCVIKLIFLNILV